jgi:hypothetical protein
MGTWGHDTFENDIVADWVLELESVKDLTLVLGAFDEVEATGDGYLEQDAACRALAACEVLARLRGRPSAAVEPAVDDWVAKHPSDVSRELSARAIRAIERILAPDSELRELRDGPGAANWQVLVESLRERVTG